MKVLKVKKKRRSVVIKLSAAQIKHILDFLDHCECKYDSKEERHMIESVNYVTDLFFPALNALLNDIEGA